MPLLTDQPELFTARPDDAGVKWLEECLCRYGRWMPAAELLPLVGRPADEAGKRWLRQLAHASEWILSGQRGYKHLDHSTAEELDHAAAWLESQARQMTVRALALRRNGHRRIG